MVVDGLRVSPGENKAIEVDPLLLGDPCGPVQPLSCFQHLTVEPLDQLLLRRRVQPLLLQVVGQSVDVWLHHFHQLTRAETPVTVEQRGQNESSKNSILAKVRTKFKDKLLLPCLTLNSCQC